MCEPVSVITLALSFLCRIDYGSMTYSVLNILPVVLNIWRLTILGYSLEAFPKGEGVRGHRVRLQAVGGWVSGWGSEGCQLSDLFLGIGKLKMHQAQPLLLITDISHLT